jgi:hypothetical protein
MDEPARDLGTDELHLEQPVTATPSSGGFFQRPGLAFASVLVPSRDVASESCF